MHEDLEKAIAKIHKAAVENGKRTGIYSTSGDQARQFADQGFHMVCILSGSSCCSRLTEIFRSLSLRM